MRDDLINGLAFAAFRRSDSGRWLVSDISNLGRVAGSDEQARALRRRALQAWVPAATFAALLSIPLGFGVGIAMGIGTAMAIGQHSIAQLPKTDVVFRRSEIAYQLRAWIALMGITVAGVGTYAALFALRSQSSFDLVLTATLFAIALGMLAAWVWCRRVRTSASGPLR